MPPATAEQLRRGAQRVLELSKVPLAEAGAADLSLILAAELEEAKEGRRSARIRVRLQRPGGAVAGEAEFRTVISEPVDDEQWQVLGEGAAYRILDVLLPLRTRKASLRLAESLEDAGPVQAARLSGAEEDAPEGGETPLRLRSEFALAPAAPAPVPHGDVQ